MPRSIPLIGQRKGKAEQTQLQHHARCEERRRLGVQHLHEQIPPADVRIEFQRKFG